MTVSGVTTYSLTANELYQAAFNILGVAQEGEAMTARMYTDAQRACNMLIGTWNAHPRLWIETEGSITLVANQAAYSFSALRILSMRYRNNGIDVPMTPMSRQEYFDQPNKTGSPSLPVSYYFDPQVSGGTIYLWPAPSSTAAAQYTINLTYVRRLSVMVNSSDTLDFPQEWQEAVTWNLAKRLMTQYPVNDDGLAQLVTAQAAEYYQNLMSWDEEPASIFLQPERRWGHA